MAAKNAKMSEEQEEQEEESYSYRRGYLILEYCIAVTVEITPWKIKIFHDIGML